MTDTKHLVSEVKRLLEEGYDATRIKQLLPITRTLLNKILYVIGLENQLETTEKAIAESDAILKEPMEWYENSDGEKFDAVGMGEVEDTQILKGKFPFPQKPDPPKNVVVKDIETKTRLKGKLETGLPEVEEPFLDTEKATQLACERWNERLKEENVPDPIEGCERTKEANKLEKVSTEKATQNLNECVEPKKTEK